ncbi:hypothetical protein N7517_010002 [Penicillium concentricum]|uniref:Uncharacterized protein n=1 Tax=Penicillium concentricum TaxID=293559 RepID=A0A9W9RIL6_9EURO|nr:uncharacterized protein N7517_010002 [Penicillium concentricum]KAJ5360811.1 hypothetical protein N7517_010002 [Penicillium concentricum]
MNPGMHFDDVAWEKNTDIYDDWPCNLYAQDACNEIRIFLSEHYRPRKHQEFRPFKTGCFNPSPLKTFTNNGGAIIRFPLPEKVRNEVSAMRFILDKTKTSDKFPIPVPFLSPWGRRKESPSKSAPFIIIDYIDHMGNMRDLLEIPISRQKGEHLILDPDISIIRLESLHGKLANIVLSLSTLVLSRRNDDSTWKVLHRPLSYSMNEIVQLGTLPRSKLPTTTYNKASSYFETLAELHISHLISQRNDSVKSEDDCRRKFMRRFLFRKLVRDKKPALSHFGVTTFDHRTSWLIKLKVSPGLWIGSSHIPPPSNLLIRCLSGFFSKSRSISLKALMTGVRSMGNDYRPFFRR